MNKLLAIIVLALAHPLFAGFASNEVFLASIGRGGGAGEAQFYSTLWVTNLSTSQTVHFTFFFLKDGQSNLTGDPSFNDTLAPGQTKLYEDVTETKLSLPGQFGAARITADGEIFASERVYNLAHATDNLGTSEGLFFAAVPKSFAIGLGETSSIQGVNQGSPTENMRTNFDLVETTGNSCKVHVTLLDSNGSSQGATDVNMLPYGHAKLNAQALLHSINTINDRIVATVTSGSGKVILAGEQLGNTSQDSSGFEMSFKDSLLGGGTGVTSLNSLTGALTLTAGTGISITPSGSSIAIAYTGGGSSGLTTVAHDSTLTGEGTGTHPLGVNPASVVTNVNGIAGPVTLSAGSNVTITPSGQTLTIDSAGLTLPFKGDTTATTAFEADTEASSGLLIGIEGGSESSAGASIGVFGIAGTDSFPEPTNPIGVLGVSSGIGVWGQGGTYEGVFGSSVSGVGVYATSTSGYGVYATSSSQDAIAGISAGRYGVVGQSAGKDGVYGSSSFSTGSGVYGTSTTWDGTHGEVNNGHAGAAGINNDATAGYGVYGSGFVSGFFQGNVTVTGNVSKMGGSFKIDHPLDPEHKYLYHSFVESPDMKNVYDGVATLDAGGSATISFPDWFETLNQDFRYQLTALDTPQPGLYISKRVSGNQFKIAGGIPGAQVSWQVTGIRHDAWANAHRIPVEETKPDDEQGTYLRPELYGQPPTKSADPIQRDRALKAQTETKDRNEP